MARCTPSCSRSLCLYISRWGNSKDELGTQCPRTLERKPTRQLVYHFTERVGNQITCNRCVQTSSQPSRLSKGKITAASQNSKYLSLTLHAFPGRCNRCLQNCKERFGDAIWVGMPIKQPMLLAVNGGAHICPWHFPMMLHAISSVVWHGSSPVVTVFRQGYIVLVLCQACADEHSHLFRSLVPSLVWNKSNLGNRLSCTLLLLHLW